MLTIFRSAWNCVSNRFSNTVDNIQQFWSDDGPGGDCFWLLDATLLLGGIRSTRWPNEHFIRYFSNCVFIYHWAANLHNLYFAILIERNDLIEMALAVTILATLIITTLMMLMISRHHESIATIRNCLTNNRVNSGDSDYDQKEQTEFNQKVRTMIKALFACSIVVSVAFSVPSPVLRKAVGLPPDLLADRPIVSSVLNSLVIFLVLMGIQHRFASILTCIGTLLLGMRSKLGLLANRYNRMLDQPVFNEGEFFSYIEPEIRETLDRHLEYWRYLSHLKKMVEMAFALLHYYSIFNTGIVLFVGKVNGMDFFSMAMVLAASFFMIEYLLLCRLVEGLQDEADKIGDIIYELCSRIPHSDEHHLKYVQLRSTLMIVWINTLHGVEMNCFGIFSISSVTFVKLVNVTYSVLSFMIGFD